MELVAIHDHLVSHAVVKQIFLEMKMNLDTSIKRLAFFTINKKEADKINARGGPHWLNFSKDEEIDCIISLTQGDVEKGKEALDCSVTYKEVIEKTGMKEIIHNKSHFEIFQEDSDPPLSDIGEGI